MQVRTRTKLEMDEEKDQDRLGMDNGKDQDRARQG